MKQSFIILVIALLCAGALSRLHADDSPFGYLYTADMLPGGHWEYEQWNTLRMNKASGDYTSLDLLNEIEHGFTDNFSTAFYLHSSFLHAQNVPDPDDATTNLRSQNNFDLNGVSVEMKYRLLSPYKDPVGLVLYMEPELAVRNQLSGEDLNERAVETKLILQKNLMEDQVVLAANITFEPEWERVSGSESKELKNNYTLGASYRFLPQWYAGVELENRRVFNDQDFRKQKASAFFAGPSLHYGSKSWWSTLTLLPQIAGNPRGLGADANGNKVSDPYRTLGEFEKMEIRLRFGVEF